VFLANAWFPVADAFDYFLKIIFQFFVCQIIGAVNAVNNFTLTSAYFNFNQNIFSNHAYQPPRLVRAGLNLKYSEISCCNEVLIKPNSSNSVRLKEN
jgi:hypothetical protein